MEAVAEVNLFDWSQKGPDDGAQTPACVEVPVAVAQTLEQRLQALYDVTFEEHQRRESALDALMESFKHDVGFAAGLLRSSFSDKFDEAEVASSMLNYLITDEGREAIGLDPDCNISSYGLRQAFLEPIKEAQQTRIYGRRRHTRYEVDEDADSGPPVVVPRLDVAAAVGWLRKRYGGEAGRRVRLHQIAKRLKDDLNVERQAFEVKAGKVTLEIRAYGGLSHDGCYDFTVRECLARTIDGFQTVMQESGQDVPIEMRCFMTRMRSIGPGQSHDITPALKLRTFKEHYRFVMAEGLAERVREFIVSNMDSEEDSD